MLDFALKELAEHAMCKAVLAAYHQRELAARQKDPEHDGWLPRVNSTNLPAGDPRDVEADSHVVARSPDRLTDGTDGLPEGAGDLRSNSVRGGETRAQQRDGSAEGRSSHVPGREIRTPQDESLSQIHGRLIALGLLTFQLTDRSSGVSYQVTPLGVRALSAGPDDGADADELPQAA